YALTFVAQRKKQLPKRASWAKHRNRNRKASSQQSKRFIRRSAGRSEERTHPACGVTSILLAFCLKGSFDDQKVAYSDRGAGCDRNGVGRLTARPNAR